MDLEFRVQYKYYYFTGVKVTVSWACRSKPKGVYANEWYQAQMLCDCLWPMKRKSPTAVTIRYQEKPPIHIMINARSSNDKFQHFLTTALKHHPEDICLLFQKVIQAKLHSSVHWIGMEKKLILVPLNNVFLLMELNNSQCSHYDTIVRMYSGTNRYEILLWA